MLHKWMVKQFKMVREKMKAHDAKYIAQQKDIDDIVTSSLFYKDDNEEMHQLNVYISKSRDENKTLPLIIDIHGGAWIYGDKDVNGLFNYEMARAGYIVVSMSYRLCVDGAKISDMMRDISDSIKYILTKQYELNFDIDNIYLMGDSCGAHLALLLCATYNSFGIEELFYIYKPEVKFKKIILNHPAPYIHDVKVVRRGWLINKLIMRSFRKLIFGTASKKEPLYIVSDFTFFNEYLDKSIPTLIISSAGDRICGEQYPRLIKFYKRNGYNFETYFEESEGSRHDYNVIDPSLEISKKCNENIIEFLKK